MPVDLIVLAAIAVFVLLRLYGVLGQKIGHDQPPARDASFDSDSKVIELTPRELEKSHIDKMTATAEEEQEGLEPNVKAGIAKIRKEDASFRLKDFEQGAQAAFEMVLEAFAKDDRDTLKMLLSKELYQNFVDEIKARKNQEDYTETTLVSILKTEITDIDVESRHAVITVAFESEQIHAQRDAAGELVKESTSSIEQVQDAWMFKRDMRSSNPNWTIIDT